MQQAQRPAVLPAFGARLYRGDLHIGRFAESGVVVDDSGFAKGIAGHIHGYYDARTKSAANGNWNRVHQGAINHPLAIYPNRLKDSRQRE
jgi:hypothetical protein